jgi:hypothetical protein
MKLKPQFYKFLLKTMILILALFIAFNTIRGATQPEQPIQIVKQHKQIANEHYIISEELVRSNLKSISERATFQEDINQKHTQVDDGFLGDRQTTLNVKGTYKMGFNDEEVEVLYIDQENKVVHLKTPKPIIVSLEIPYDQIDFDKTKGWLRLAMDEDEEKAFYKSVKSSIKKKLLEDEETLENANLYNKEAIEKSLLKMSEIKGVVFE